jgi:phosphoribosyl 1,2-cyclic phosphodiesterase
MRNVLIRSLHVVGGNVMRQTLTSIHNILKIIVRFWGVRGSYVTSDTRIGNHTSCISIEYGDQVLIIDAGTGAIDAAQHVIAEYISKGRQVHITFLFSHRHKDHRDGLTSFYPFFFPNVDITLIGFEHESKRDGKIILEGLEANLRAEVFGGSSFPVEWDNLLSKKTFRTENPGEYFTIPCAVGGDIRVLALEMFHPQRAYGFRIEIAGRVIAITPDHEDAPGTEFNKNILRLADRANLQATEAQYTMKRYLGPPNKLGWGHMHVEASVIEVRTAKPDICYTIHHEPLAEFDEVREIAEGIQDGSGVKTIFATQGDAVEL